MIATACVGLQNDFTVAPDFHDAESGFSASCAVHGSCTGYERVNHMVWS